MQFDSFTAMQSVRIVEIGMVFYSFNQVSGSMSTNPPDVENVEMSKKNYNYHKLCKTKHFQEIFSETRQGIS